VLKVGFLPLFIVRKVLTMKVRFWLSDVSHEVKEHTPEIWLWGIDDSGNRVLVIDRTFLHTFML